MIGKKATTLQYLATYAKGRVGATVRHLERAEWVLVSDIDGTLIGGPNPRLGELKSWLATIPPRTREQAPVQTPPGAD